jgi:maltose O-acetyltransferase
MRSERQKMLAGEPYDPGDPQLTAARARARDLCQAFNATRAGEGTRRRELLHALLGSGAEDAVIEPPFFCDYGGHIHLGRNVYFNFHCTVLDVCEVRIGDHALFGPGVQLLTPLHPLDPVARRGREYGRPITIGADAWIGGGALVLAGVDVGEGAVIGAGSVVTRDVPARVLAAGNPCRVIRALD